MTWQATVLTLYPDLFPGSLGCSLAGRALKNKIWQLDTINIRDFAEDKHGTVDDTPYGGGAGMVLKADIVGKALDTLDLQKRPCYYLSPRGAVFTQEHAQTLAEADGVVLLCGHFEGIDARILEHYPITELSIGDYVLSGGETAALVVLDAAVRLLPGVMGDDTSAHEESFSNGLLEYPHYTRPAEWRGLSVPEILRSGNHGAVAQWRQQQAEALTQARRPDLWDAYQHDKINMRKGKGHEHH